MLLKTPSKKENKNSQWTLCAAVHGAEPFHYNRGQCVSLSVVLNSPPKNHGRVLCFGNEALKNSSKPHQENKRGNSTRLIQAEVWLWFLFEWSYKVASESLKCAKKHQKQKQKVGRLFYQLGKTKRRWREEASVINYELANCPFVMDIYISKQGGNTRICPLFTRHKYKKVPGANFHLKEAFHLRLACWTQKTYAANTQSDVLWQTDKQRINK